LIIDCIILDPLLFLECLHPWAFRRLLPCTFEFSVQSPQVQFNTAQLLFNLIVCILSTPVFSVWVLGQFSVQFLNWYVPVLGGYLFFILKNHHHFRVFEKKEKKNQSVLGISKIRMKESAVSGYLKNIRIKQTAGSGYLRNHQQSKNCVTPGISKPSKKPLVFIKE